MESIGAEVMEVARVAPSSEVGSDGSGAAPVLGAASALGRASAVVPPPPGGSTGPSPSRESGRECEKHGLVEAVLERERYGSILELGCGDGTLGRLLAERCRHYVGMDTDAAALVAARCRTRAGVSMRFLPLRTPLVLPRGRHELVVLSDVLPRLEPEIGRDLAGTLAAHAPCREIVVVGTGDERDGGRNSALDAFAAALGGGFARHELARRRHYRIDALLRGDG